MRQLLFLNAIIISVLIMSCNNSTDKKTTTTTDAQSSTGLALLPIENFTAVVDGKQGNLFFHVAEIIEKHRPKVFFLENVKNLKSHNKGDTYQSILEALDAAGYDVPEPQVINARNWLPQNRERIVIVGFRKDLNIAKDFDITKVKPAKGQKVVTLGELLEADHEVDDKYILTDNLWDYLQAYKAKHRGNGNGFGYDLFTPDSTYTRTLSARYYKDGSEILVDQGDDKNPRRLTPRECARLMGFPDTFKIPVSDTRAYKQFGNSVVVPVMEAVARAMRPHICTPSTAAKSKK